MPLLPSFSLTGNSCPARSWRPCQHPPLEYFKAKSENDQPPPNLFFHRPYMGILVALGFLLPPSAVYKKMQTHSPGRHSQRVHSHSHTPPPTPQLPHWHIAAQSGTRSHGHTLARSRCCQASTHFPPGHSHLAQSARSHVEELHPGQEGSHTGDTTLDPSPAAHTRPSPDVPSCGHMEHNSQATPSTAHRHQFSFAIA